MVKSRPICFRVKIFQSHFLNPTDTTQFILIMCGVDEGRSGILNATVESSNRRRFLISQIGLGCTTNAMPAFQQLCCYGWVIEHDIISRMIFLTSTISICAMV